MAAVLPGVVGAAFATAISSFAVLNEMFQLLPAPDRASRGIGLEGTDLLIVQLCYAPILATGPMLGAVVWDYYRRRKIG